MHPDQSATPTRWRVRPALPVLKLAGAVALVGLGLLLGGGDPVPIGVSVLAGVGLLGWAVRDLVAPVRLAVDPAGVTVIRGFAGQRRLAWSQVERIAVDSRPRLGLRTGTLELDAGDSLHFFSRYDLGAEPGEVANALRMAKFHAGNTSAGPAEQP
ncbi:PH domain-containing protein [Micromonospora sp. NBC_01699]|uniref:PH domain-containing protein n=1 Tax=Micromonospora sp. NBC_01699 TaxID=2975984 RepID=UPI002E2C8CBE|nr:PH domain-containing protein [Micromonospora sp. NBC_01699]